MAATQQVQWQDVRNVFSGQQVQQAPVAQYVVNIGQVQQGAVVNFAASGRQAADRIRPRPAPPRVLPRAVHGFLNREQEQGQMGQALARSQVVDVHGPDGVGKTALVSQTMQTQLPSAFPDGMVYLTARHETREDLLQDLFKSFYETDGNVKVTENDVRRYMAGKRALVTIDDANHLEQGDAEEIAQALPQCALVVSGREQQVWQGAGVPLQGLPHDQAVTLFERHWGALSSQDRPTAEAICGALGGMPLAIIRTATSAAASRQPLAQVLQQVQPRGSRSEPVGQAFWSVASQLTEEERRVLGALAAPGGETVAFDALPAITGLPPQQIGQHLQRLQGLGLVHANSPRFSLDNGFKPYIYHYWADEGTQARAADYYMRQAHLLQGRARDPDEANVIGALRYYYGRKLWRQVVYVARAIEPYLAMTGRWGQWKKRLNYAWKAARAIGDRAAEAWAQNQLGVIALCLGDKSAAQQLLRGALAIWRALGDRTGMTITRWNLQILFGVPPIPPRGKPPTKPPAGPSGLTVALAGTATAVSVVFGIVLWWYITRERPTPPPPPPPPVTTVVLRPTTRPPPATTLAPPPTTVAPPTTAPPPTTVVPPTTPPPTTPPPPPQVDVQLSAGCDRSYDTGSPLTIQVWSSVDGVVDLYLTSASGSMNFLNRVQVGAGQTTSLQWEAPTLPGYWRYQADLNSGQARDECGFTVESVVVPEVDISLYEGCDRSYDAGSPLTIQVWSSVDGGVDLYQQGPTGGRDYMFSVDVGAGQTASLQWEAPTSPGYWRYEADLNSGQAQDECGFTVEPVVVPEVDISLYLGCDQEYGPGDYNEIYVWTSVAGHIRVVLDGTQQVFEADVAADDSYWESWDVPETPGSHRLEVYQDGAGPYARCDFTVRAPPPPCARFEDLLPGPGERMMAEEIFATEGVMFKVGGYGWVYAGTQNYASGTGQELYIADANVRMVLTTPVSGLSLRFYDDNNPFELEINGELVSGLFTGFDGETVGDVAIRVENVGSAWTIPAGFYRPGILYLDGEISSFLIGGDSLYIDDICP